MVISFVYCGVYGVVYGLEFFVVVGDIEIDVVYVGCGGWSWYIGVVGWLLCVVVESLCGVCLVDGLLCV